MDHKPNLKILEVITKSNFGGAQKYVFEMATGLAKQNHEVMVAFGGNGLLKQKLSENGIRTITIKSLQKNISILKDIKTFIELIKIIRNEKPDIVHLNSSKIGALGSIATRLFTKSKSIFTIHGLAYKENRNFISKLLIKKVYWLTILFSHKSISVSEQVKNDLMKNRFFRILKNKIVVIENEINQINFFERGVSRQKLSAILSEKYGTKLSDNEIIIGSIGELHPIKGYDLLIKASQKIFQENPKIRLIIIGEGQDKRLLEKQIKDLKMPDKILLPGFIDDAAKYLKSFDIFVSSSLSEGMPLVILEAIQANLPIICTNVGSNSKTLIEYSHKKIIEPGDEKGLHNSLKELLSNLTTRGYKFKYTEGNKSKSPYDKINKMLEKTIKVFLS